MNIYLLYALLPVIIFPLTGVILAKASREIGSMRAWLLRQVILLIIGLPIMFFSASFFLDVKQYYLEIFLSGLFGSLYIFCMLKSCDYIEVIQARVITMIVRILISIVVWILFIGEVISTMDVVWIVTILVWISLYLKIKNDNVLPKYNLPLWLAISIIAGMLFIGSQYYFSVYAQAFSPLTAAYVLEVAAIPFLMMMIYIIHGYKGLENTFLHTSWKNLKVLFFWSAPVLLGSYGLAQSYNHLDFIVANILFSLTLVMAGIFGYFILWEKLTKLQIVIFSMMLGGIFIVNYF